MSETSNNNKPKVNVPRPSLTWLYVLIALVFIRIAVAVLAPFGQEDIK